MNQQEALQKIIQAHTDSIEALGNLVMIHDRQLKGVLTFMEASERADEALAAKHVAEEQMRANLIAWMNATDARLEMLTQKLGLA